MPVKTRSRKPKKKQKTTQNKKTKHESKSFPLHQTPQILAPVLFSSKPLQKSQFLSVNLVQLCKSLIESSNEFSLRLASILLFGIVRLFYAKSRYLESQARKTLQSAQTSKTVDDYLSVINLPLVDLESRFQSITILPPKPLLMTPEQFSSSESDLSSRSPAMSFLLDIIHKTPRHLSKSLTSKFPSKSDSIGETPSGPSGSDKLSTSEDTTRHKGKSFLPGASFISITPGQPGHQPQRIPSASPIDFNTRSLVDSLINLTKKLQQGEDISNEGDTLGSMQMIDLLNSSQASTISNVTSPSLRVSKTDSSLGIGSMGDDIFGFGNSQTNNFAQFNSEIVLKSQRSSNSRSLSPFESFDTMGGDSGFFNPSELFEMHRASVEKQKSKTKQSSLEIDTLNELSKYNFGDQNFSEGAADYDEDMQFKEEDGINFDLSSLPNIRGSDFQGSDSGSDSVKHASVMKSDEEFFKSVSAEGNSKSSSGTPFNSQEGASFGTPMFREVTHDIQEIKLALPPPPYTRDSVLDSSPYIQISSLREMISSTDSLTEHKVVDPMKHFKWRTSVRQLSKFTMDEPPLDFSLTSPFPTTFSDSIPIVSSWRNQVSSFKSLKSSLSSASGSHEEEEESDVELDDEVMESESEADVESQAQVESPADSDFDHSLSTTVPSLRKNYLTSFLIEDLFGTFPSASPSLTPEELRSGPTGGFLSTNLSSVANIDETEVDELLRGDTRGGPSGLTGVTGGTEIHPGEESTYFEDTDFAQGFEDEELRFDDTENLLSEFATTIGTRADLDDLAAALFDEPHDSTHYVESPDSLRTIRSIRTRPREHDANSPLGESYRLINIEPDSGLTPILTTNHPVSERILQQVIKSVSSTKHRPTHDVGEVGESLELVDESTDLSFPFAPPMELSSDVSSTSLFRLFNDNPRGLDRLVVGKTFFHLLDLAALGQIELVQNKDYEDIEIITSTKQQSNFTSSSTKLFAESESF